MSPDEHDPTQDETTATDQSQPTTGIDADPSQNTSPPSNPPVDERAVREGEEKLGGIVNW